MYLTCDVTGHGFEESRVLVSRLLKAIVQTSRFPTYVNIEAKYDKPRN